MRSLAHGNGRPVVDGVNLQRNIRLFECSIFVDIKVKISGLTNVKQSTAAFSVLPVTANATH